MLRHDHDSDVLVLSLVLNSSFKAQDEEVPQRYSRSHYGYQRHSFFKIFFHWQELREFGLGIIQTGRLPG
jgi:hypothetical protein